MSIQWFPGHMHKARKEIKKIIMEVDLIIELTDARIPYSSSNPMITALRDNKPCIKAMTKSDLADPVLTSLWQQYFEQHQQTKSIALSVDEPAKTRQLIELCKLLVPEKGKGHNNINIMILGIPNVGKSTLINTLAGRTIAKTGNEPAITKGQQRINLRNGIMLWDTPGMLWPKIESPYSGYRLAATGAIKDTAMSYDDVAAFTVEYLLKHYPEPLQERFQLSTLPETDTEFLEAAGKKRGCLGSGGHVDFEKISTIVLNEMRSGKLGPITLETPEMIAIETLAVEKAIAEKEAKKEARKNLNKNRKKSR